MKGNSAYASEVANELFGKGQLSTLAEALVCY